MAINTNNNSYTIVYATIVVVIVAFLLSFVSKVLEPQSLANERIDKKKQILASLNIRNLSKDSVETYYQRVIVRDEVVNSVGEVVKDGQQKDKDGFAVSMKEIGTDNLPVYVCQVGDGDEGTKYVFPLSGKGLWGAIWGYIALDSDMNTVYGTYFSHQSETAGLGALITEEAFQSQFKGKKIRKDGSQTIDLAVVKNGQVKDSSIECDGITGATLTSNGVSDMLVSGLDKYKDFLTKGNK